MAEGAPWLLVLIGLPGSGKSTLARALSARLALPVVDRDAIRAAMFPPDGEGAGAHEKPAATGATWLAVRARLEAGQGCIIDGMTFASVAEREHADGLARAFGARCLQVAVEVSQRLAIERVRKQPHASPERGPALVRRVAARFAPLAPEVLWLDGRQPADVLAARVCAALDAPPG